eukprot:357684-Chlamydomonas_euryale.AAC.1
MPAFCELPAAGSLATSWLSSVDFPMRERPHTATTATSPRRPRSSRAASGCTTNFPLASSNPTSCTEPPAGAAEAPRTPNKPSILPLAQLRLALALLLPLPRLPVQMPPPRQTLLPMPLSRQTLPRASSYCLSPAWGTGRRECHCLVNATVTQAHDRRVACHSERARGTGTP